MSTAGDRTRRLLTPILALAVWQFTRSGRTSRLRPKTHCRPLGYFGPTGRLGRMESYSQGNTPIGSGAETGGGIRC